MGTAVAAFWLALATTACGTPEPAPRPNVVLISIDTLRADRLSVYGYRRPTSPHLEALAREAVVFDRFYQNGGGTLPSHMTMMTSLRPAVHGLRPGDGKRLPEQRVTLAEQLRAAGYATRAWVDAGWVLGKFGFDQGFDVYDDGGGRFGTILPKAATWLREARSEPFFLFLHTYDVHSQSTRLPYECPGRYPGSFADLEAASFDGCRSGRCATALLQWANGEMQAGRLDPSTLFTTAEVELMSSLYDGCIRYVDTEIASLLELLRELDLYDRTMVVVTSDHGEEFLEHGRFLHVQGGYEELVRVPLLIKLPGSLHGGTRVSHLAAMVDLMPTILEIVGVPTNAEAQGTSLMPAVRDGRPVRDEAVILSAIRTHRWKLLTDRDALFDLDQDPGELVNVSGREPATAARLAAALARTRSLDATHARRLAAAAESSTLSAEEEQELRALGYL